MKYIVIETANEEWPSIVTDEDGKPLIFEDSSDALKEAFECQKGIVTPLNNLYTQIEQLRPTEDEVNKALFG